MNLGLGGVECRVWWGVLQWDGWDGWEGKGRLQVHRNSVVCGVLGRWSTLVLTGVPFCSPSL